MTQPVITGTILDKIVAQTRLDLEVCKQHIEPAIVRTCALASRKPVDVAAALRQSTVQILAEFKRASPSKGRFPVEIDPSEVARAYVDGGAAAISCLTDGPFFQGSLGDLEAVAAIASSHQPAVGVLRKDFTIDPYQIDEARAAGASAVLLIAACLSDDDLESLHAYARELDLSVIVEVHDAEELARALVIEPQIVGINNRNLKTLEVNLGVSSALAPLIPAHIAVVAESGISKRAEVEALGRIGVDAVLVGESLIVQADRAQAVRLIAGVEKQHRG